MELMNSNNLSPKFAIIKILIMLLKIKKINRITLNCVLILIVLLVSIRCDKVEFDEINVEYSKCICDHETNFIKEFSVENILLFDKTKTSFLEMKELSSDGDCSSFVDYSSDPDSTFCYSSCGAIVSFGFICNLPEIVNDWEIPQEGIYISFSADEFELCEPRTSLVTQMYSNLILKSLKKHKK